MNHTRVSQWIHFCASLMAILLTAENGQAFVTPAPSRSMSTINSAPVSTSTIDRSKIHFQGSFQKTREIPQSRLYMATKDGEKSGLPFWLDPGTRGGAVFLSLILFILPLIAYSVVTSFFGVDEVEAGKWIGVGFTATASVLWVATYIFRVATKDMTYAKQLKDYENAVIAKRLEELDDDEIQALVEEIERDEF